MFEGWGAGLAAAGAVSAIGSGISSSEQAGAAESAAGDQEQASLAQLGLDTNVFNAQATMAQPTRELGGEAQSREAYLLGLDPNLNISTDFQTPTIGIDPTTGTSSLSWSGGTPTAGMNPGTSGTSPVYFGGQYYGGAAGTGSGAPAPMSTIGGPAVGPLSSGINAIAAQQNGGSTSPGVAPTTGGAPNPNGSMPSSSFGSFSNPYNPSTFYEDPGYNFILGQGQQQIQNQQATTGMALSPAALGAALNYSSGLASQEFNNAYNRSMNTQTTQLNELNSMISGGQIATSGVSTAASGLGTAGSSALAGYGNAGAAGAIGVGNAYSSGINGATNSITGSIANYNALNSLNGGGINGGNPYNLGGSTPVAPAGSQLTYDQWGNITGSVPTTS